jgi:hypothetical protein
MGYQSTGEIDVEEGCKEALAAAGILLMDPASGACRETFLDLFCHSSGALLGKKEIPCKFSGRRFKFA